MPFLKKVSLDWSRVTPADKSSFPFNLIALQNFESYPFSSNVTFFIGDNGSGKSTLLEAIGASCGFSIVGGRDLVISKEKDDLSLASIMQLSWLPQVKGGFTFALKPLIPLRIISMSWLKTLLSDRPHILHMAANRLMNSRMDKDF